MPVTPSDYAAISDLLARYCWLIDEGDAEAWLALWADGGVFTGVSPEPFVGREALRAVVTMAQALGPGMMRHMVTNLACDYVDGEDRVLAAYYNLVTRWNDGAQIALLALSRVQLVRSGSSWLIARNDSTLLPG
jgi:SnoaL-like domain